MSNNKEISSESGLSQNVSISLLLVNVSVSTSTTFNSGRLSFLPLLRAAMHVFEHASADIFVMMLALSNLPLDGPSSPVTTRKHNQKQLRNATALRRAAHSWWELGSYMRVEIGTLERVDQLLIGWNPSSPLMDPCPTLPEGQSGCFIASTYR